jgi:hypothetical protein
VLHLALVFSGGKQPDRRREEMGWDLTEINVDRPGSPASSFSFELRLPEAEPGQRILHGDGVVLTRLGRVLVNRERELDNQLRTAGVDSFAALSELRSRALTAAQPEELVASGQA